jgi:GNAT superfamily N-acetyltransferase
MTGAGRLPALPGQDTLQGCWRALADTAFGPGRLVATSHAVAAVFPNAAYFNNAILTTSLECAGDAATELRDLYDDAGVTTWALWVPSRTPSFGAAPDRIDTVGPLTRDVTTLVMRCDLSAGLRLDDRVTTASERALRRLVDEDAVPTRELGDHRGGSAVTAWALSHDGQAVTSAYTYRHGTDCGIYAVGTLPPWRRRGLARALVEHILADACATGARTATLQSTPMGESVYRALGFQPVGRYEEWLHSPRAETGAAAR